MRNGMVTGCRACTVPDLAGAWASEVGTRFGAALVTESRFAGADLRHAARLGDGLRRLVGHDTHRGTSHLRCD